LPRAGEGQHSGVPWEEEKIAWSVLGDNACATVPAWKERRRGREKRDGISLLNNTRIKIDRSGGKEGTGPPTILRSTVFPRRHDREARKKGGKRRCFLHFGLFGKTAHLHQPPRGEGKKVHQVGDSRYVFRDKEEKARGERDSPNPMFRGGGRL